jgi:hypothetical protein
LLVVKEAEVRESALALLGRKGGNKQNREPFSAYALAVS